MHETSAVPVTQFSFSFARTSNTRRIFKTFTRVMRYTFMVRFTYLCYFSKFYYEFSCWIASFSYSIKLFPCRIFFFFTYIITLLHTYSTENSSIMTVSDCVSQAEVMVMMIERMGNFDFINSIPLWIIIIIVIIIAYGCVLFRFYVRICHNNFNILSLYAIFCHALHKWFEYLNRFKVECWIIKC